MYNTSQHSVQANERAKVRTCPTPQLVVLIALGVLLAAGCGGSSPAAPSAPQRWRLSGTITSTRVDAAGAAVLLTDAIVRIDSGANAGQQTLTDSSGHFVFQALEAGAMTVRISAADHEAATREVSLNADSVVDVRLTKSLKANLVTERIEADGVAQADGTFAVTLAGRNIGDGCAGSVTGIVDLAASDGRQVASMPWSLAAGAIVRAGEVFPFTACCFGSQYAGGTLSYTTRFTFQTVGCS